MPVQPGDLDRRRRAARARRPAARSAATVVRAPLGVERVGGAQHGHRRAGLGERRRHLVRGRRSGRPRRPRSRRPAAGCGRSRPARCRRPAARAWPGTRAAGPGRGQQGVRAVPEAPRTARPAGSTGSPPPAGLGHGRRAATGALVEVGELAHPGDRGPAGGHVALPPRPHRRRSAPRAARSPARRRAPPAASISWKNAHAARASSAVSDSTYQEPPAGSITRARCASSTSSAWVLRAIRRENGSDAAERGVERRHGDRVGAADPGGEPGDGAAQQVPVRVAPGEHRRRADGVLELRAGRAAGLGDPRPQPPGRAQLGDRRELLGGRRVAELQQPRPRWPGPARRRPARAGRPPRPTSDQPSSWASEPPAACTGSASTTIARTRGYRSATRRASGTTAPMSGPAPVRGRSPSGSRPRVPSRSAAGTPRSAATARNASAASSAVRLRRPARPGRGRGTRRPARRQVGDGGAAVPDGQPDRADAVLQVGGDRRRGGRRVGVAVPLPDVPAVGHRSGGPGPAHVRGAARHPDRRRRRSSAV